MAATPQQQHQNLQRLLGSILGSPPCSCADDASAAACLRDAQRMPLSHSTSQTVFDAIVATDQLLSNDARGVISRPVDIELGTTNDVFVYLGTPAFPKKEFAFVFKCSLTESNNCRAVATPFDSGGCATHFGLPAGTHVAFVRNHELPVPECRGYLAAMLGHCFASVESYLSGYPYFECPGCHAALADPHGLQRSPSQDHGLDRVHEVRIEGKISLDPHLAAVIVPRGFASPSLARLRSRGVRVITYERDAPDPNPLRARATAVFLSEFLAP